MRYQSRRLEAGTEKCKKCAHLRLQHKNSSELLKIATSLCLYLGAALRLSGAPKRSSRKKEGRKKSFHFIVECGALLFVLFLHNFSFFHKNIGRKKICKKTATQIIIAPLAYAVCCFFFLLLSIFIDDEETTAKLHFKYSISPEGSVSRRSSFASA